MSPQKSLLATLMTAAILTGCGSDDNNKSATQHFVEDFPAEGVFLPYSVLSNDLIDHNTGSTFEVRNGGYGSAMFRDPKNPNRFYAITDRGPNAVFSGDYGSGKKFPVPDYTPRLGLFEISSAGAITLVSETLMKRPDGTAITGLPNSSDLGGTGETPYHADGSPILEDDSLPYDADTNPLKLDDYGLDPEGLVVLSDGSFWVSDEYGPHMVHFNSEGVEIGRINPFANDDRNSYTLPAEFAYRRANRGMEGLAITPDEKTLFGIMQSTMDLPTKAVRSLDITRIVSVNLETGAVSQYLYQQEKNANSNSELMALSAHEFILIERDGSFLYGGPNGTEGATPDAMKHVYRIDISAATDLEAIDTSDAALTQDADLGLLINGNTLEQQVLADGDWSTLTGYGIVPVTKSLVVDMVAEVNYPHDKMEGLWVIDENTLGVLNDDDFATWSTDGELEQKMLDSNTIDGDRLYVVPADLSVTE